MGTTSEANIKIIVERSPSEARLSELGIKSWPKWGCPPGKMTLKYDATETCYFVKGRVKAYPKGSTIEEAVEFGAGDLVIFPKGLSCTWDVSVLLINTTSLILLLTNFTLLIN
ncbi:Triosephosphate isomerase [Bienertia sinuspersici]